jgi:hypothetical protein
MRLLLMLLLVNQNTPCRAGMVPASGAPWRMTPFERAVHALLSCRPLPC